MSIKIKRDERQVFTGGSFVMTSTVLIKIEDNRIYNVTDEEIIKAINQLLKEV